MTAPDPAAEAKPSRVDCPVHRFFGLSYCAWLTLPRLSLQEMPVEWQERFVAMLEEGYELGLTGPGDTIVSRKIGGRFADLGEWGDYRRGSVSHAIEADREKGIKHERD